VKGCERDRASSSGCGTRYWAVGRHWLTAARGTKVNCCLLGPRAEVITADGTKNRFARLDASEKHVRVSIAGTWTTWGSYIGDRLFRHGILDFAWQRAPQIRQAGRAAPASSAAAPGSTARRTQCLKMRRIGSNLYCDMLVQSRMRALRQRW
jgi:hypothetical protein